MIEQVLMYKTNDGRLFNDEEVAEKYVVNEVQEYLGKHICTHVMSVKERLKLMESLAGDLQKCKTLYKALEGILHD